MIYATSDWHGRDLKTVKALFKKVNFKDSDFCFVLGNVIDGGDSGVELLEWLMEQYNVELLLGSHEQLLLMNEHLFTEGASPDLTPVQQALLAKWTQMGALPTVTALKKRKAAQREYIFEYLQDAALFETVNVNDRDYILTHSGLGHFSVTKKLGDYTPEELLWNTLKLTDRYFEDVTAVFGHTPTADFGEEYDGKVLRTDTWVDINAGPLTLLRLDDGKAFYAD